MSRGRKELLCRTREWMRPEGKERGGSMSADRTHAPTQLGPRRRGHPSRRDPAQPSPYATPRPPLAARPPARVALRDAETTPRGETHRRSRPAGRRSDLQLPTITTNEAPQERTSPFPPVLSRRSQRAPEADVGLDPQSALSGAAAPEGRGVEQPRSSASALPGLRRARRRRRLGGCHTRHSTLVGDSRPEPASLEIGQFPNVGLHPDGSAGRRHGGPPRPPSRPSTPAKRRH